MKNLIYKNETYYISDDTSDTKGKTRILKYKASPEEMPHKHFSKYIIIYGRHTCPYCIKTIELLKKYPKVLFIEIDTEPNILFSKKNLLNILKPEIKEHTTVPIVFDKGKFIGGASDAETYFVSTT
jgi:glutaredoxin